MKQLLSYSLDSPAIIGKVKNWSLIQYVWAKSRDQRSSGFEPEVQLPHPAPKDRSTDYLRFGMGVLDESQLPANSFGRGSILKYVWFLSPKNEIGLLASLRKIDKTQTEISLLGCLMERFFERLWRRIGMVLCVMLVASSAAYLGWLGFLAAVLLGLVFAFTAEW